jgi:hypothetical protein
MECTLRTILDCSPVEVAVAFVAVCMALFIFWAAITILRMQ